MVKGVKSVVVAGDVTVDWIGWQKKSTDECAVPSAEQDNWTLYSGLRMIARPGGVLLLKSMLETALAQKEILIPVYSHTIDRLETLDPNTIIHSNTIVKPYPCSSDRKNDSSRVYRIARFCGFAGPDQVQAKLFPIEQDDPKASVVIIDDAGNGFRNQKQSWPKALLRSKNRPHVILKMSRPLQKGELWEHLVRDHGDELVVIITANDLRECGVHISYGLSWERTAEDFMRQMKHNPQIRQLSRCRNLIVRFGLDGVIHYSYRADDTTRAVLYFDPKGHEDGFKERHPGAMQGFSNAFTASLSSTLIASGFGAMEDAIRQGIVSSRMLMEYGMGQPPKEPDYPFSRLFGSPNLGSTFVAVEIPDPLRYQLKKRESWTILETMNETLIEEVAYDIVKTGQPASFDTIPIGTYGDLRTIDRNEIESYQSIKNLIREYLRKSATRHPLCIAVFGPPGSGKSFGVSQLVKSIGDRRIEKIEFNLSQYNDPDQLICAFHAVRDLVLKGNIPLVFFDEFDASLRGEPLGWLKYFLAPMQDGTFKDGESMHPIGKAIFVFAGGTHPSFHAFSQYSPEPGEAVDENEKKAWEKGFRDAKGTDFLSRLRGYIDILGCNRADENDRFYMVRRALLLRSLLERYAAAVIDEKKIARVDNCVIRAFLKAPEFRHGVRSMEAIIDMSLLSKKTCFGQSSLPSTKQLKLHVDDGIFMQLVLQDVLFGTELDNLAKSVHHQYLETMKGQDPAQYPAMVEWDVLPEDYQDSNRRAANSIPLKLQAVNYGFRPVCGAEIQPIEFTDEELEILARLEHDLWVEERVEKGWTYGPKRDDEKKIHPDIREWNDLSTFERKKDFDQIRAIPTIMAGAGFEVYRLH